MALILSLIQSDTVQTHVVAAIVTATLTGVGQLLRAKGRISWGTSHSFVFAIPQNPPQLLSVKTQTIFVQNVGRATAENIEVHLAGKPEHYQIWPTFQYTGESNPENYFVIKIPSLGRREFFTIEMLASGDNILPIVTRVRTPEGVAKQVLMAPMQVFSPWVGRALVLSALVALFFVIQLLVKAIW